MTEYLFGTGSIDTGLETSGSTQFYNPNQSRVSRLQSLDNGTPDALEELTSQINASHLSTPEDTIDMLSSMLRVSYEENTVETLVKCHPIEAMAEMERHGYTLQEIQNHPSLQAFLNEYYAQARKHLKSK